MLASAIIDKKRDSLELSRDEIQFMIAGLVDGTVPDYQVSAWAMAVLCRGMNASETADLTACMLNSGQRLERPTARPRVDKHSTGGLGDKVSLVLAPLLACFDLDVPMLSGRGLGITGGTLDKLESYRGYRCDLSASEINQQLSELGCVITGTTPDIAPADRKLYALRDVTGTVPSMPLITASIMSKKLAASLDALVLDVKCGSGAFMRTKEDAQALANMLAETGKQMQVPTVAVLSDMNQPLGKMVGNACEANEAVEILSDAAEPNDVRELTLRLCSELLLALRKFDSLQAAQTALTKTLAAGHALERFERMIAAQQGDFVPKLSLAREHVLESKRSGWLQAIDGQALGRVVIALGGGRQRQGDRIDPKVGLEMLVKIGDPIDANQPLLRVFSDDENKLSEAKNSLTEAFAISEKSVPRQPLFL